jgi:predicted MFS family arabinose efflux permease
MLHYTALLVLLLLLRYRGRRTAGLAYAVIYSLSCVTKHSPKFHVLMVGRVLGGIATSLLYSAFESWLVAEHFKRGFSGAV